MVVTSRQALAFIEEHGVVLESAHGSAPSLAEFVAGEPVRGSWWSHAKGRQIFALTRAIRSNGDILVCRLIDGKVTFVHRRLWPALVRMADRFEAKRVSQLREVHTSAGQHVTAETSLPDWVPSDVHRAARNLSEEAALGEIGAWVNGEASR
ncbi:MAG: hypothetical protein ABI882_16525 [Acidobacteriota bacterium]